MNLPQPELTLYAFALFMFAMGVFFFYEAKNHNEKDDILAVRIVFLMLALLYISMAHLSMYAAIVTQIDLGTTPECENLVNDTTLDVTTNITSYTYTNSCAGVPVSGGLVAILETYGVILGIMAAFIFFGLMFVGFKWFAGAW